MELKEVQYRVMWANWTTAWRGLLECSCRGGTYWPHCGSVGVVLLPRAARQHVCVGRTSLLAFSLARGLVFDTGESSKLRLVTSENAAITWKDCGDEVHLERVISAQIALINVELLIGDCEAATPVHEPVRWTDGRAEESHVILISRVGPINAL